MEIRLATVRDCEEMRAIYAPYVEETAVSFEYEVPDPETFRGRVEKTLQEYPWLAAVEDGTVIGYAYASFFHSTRPAYRHSAEVSIYLARDRRRRGTGRLLYRELEKRLLLQNVYVLFACVTCTDREKDDYLTDDSLRFHRAMGYEDVGKNALCGYKFDRWYSVAWLEKVIAPRPEHPAPFIPLSGLPESAR